MGSAFAQTDSVNPCCFVGDVYRLNYRPEIVENVNKITSRAFSKHFLLHDYPRLLELEGNKLRLLKRSFKRLFLIQLIKLIDRVQLPQLLIFKL